CLEAAFIGRQLLGIGILPADDQRCDHRRGGKADRDAEEDQNGQIFPKQGFHDASVFWARTGQQSACQSPESSAPYNSDMGMVVKEKSARKTAISGRNSGCGRRDAQSGWRSRERGKWRERRDLNPRPPA